ncbi:hypothetical protein V502_00220 [Pseudogymnoascus sp. VKM F-4520 (FW-2644)]|nr:hypothetical protein V502_00220 [Pseudogymnoascus sp. VKM F-4520 (FW-2644)]
MPTVKLAKESVCQSPITTEPSSPSAPTSSHANGSGWSPPLSTSPSSDNLARYVTPSSTWDSRSIQALSELASLQSPVGSSTYLLSRRQNGNETPLGGNSGATTPVFDGKHHIRNPCYTIHEKIYPEPPYHVFSRRKKKRLMYLAAIAGMFSSLSANIYFPALGQISRDINVGLPLLSLTITVYMVAQALAPSFWGPLSDTRGRRVTFIWTFVVYIAANLGLALSTGFVPLMVLRGMQAAGSAATISIGQGLISDIATPSERGPFTGTNQGIRMFGQAIGPVFGGIISQYLGYHAIFWFLFGGGIVALVILVVFLPETLRPIAGNGSICLKGIHRPIYYSFAPSEEHLVERDLPSKKKLTPSIVFTPFLLLHEKDVFSIILFGSIVYTVWSMVTSSTTALFQDRFHLSDLQVGLVFLPNGIASMLGSYLTGKLSKHDWDVMEARYRAGKNIPAGTPLLKKELVDFPFSQARMRSLWWMVLVFIVCTALYGFSLSLNLIALPLILQFAISYTASSIFALNSTLVIDLFPHTSASATAVNNLVRCFMGSGGVAVVQLIVDAIAAGPTFAIWAAITTALTPLLVLQWQNGQRWQMERRDRVAAREAHKREAKVEKARVVVP